MQKVTVMFDLDARLLALLQQDAARRGLSVADVLRNAVSTELRMRPSFVDGVAAPSIVQDVV